MYEPKQNNYTSNWHLFFLISFFNDFYFLSTKWCHKNIDFLNDYYKKSKFGLTFFSGTPPSNDKPVGEYPHVVQKSGGDQTLVVQDYAFGKYLGFLQVKFDDNGKVITFGGNPILLNSSIPKGILILNTTAKLIQ